MSNNTVVLEVEGITKTFPGVVALNNVSMHACEAEVLGIVGENGAGKSTLMKILNGVYSVDTGSVKIDGKIMKLKNPIDAAAHGIAIIYQELSLIQQLSVVENMFIGKWESKNSGFLNWKLMKEEARKVFEKYNVSIPLEATVRDLSVAQCQIIEILRASSSGAKIIIMDEPTSFLSNKEVDLLFNIIRDLQKQGITILYITHRLDELFQICNRIYVLKDGMNSGEFAIENATTNKLINAMIGRNLENFFPKRAKNNHSKEVVMSVRHLNCKNLIKNAGFEVYKGEILGFFGLVGSGRTEMMRSIFGAEDDVSGKIVINGKEFFPKNPLEAIRNGIVYASEDRKREGLVLSSPVSWNTTIANLKTVSDKAGFLDLKREFSLTKSFIEKMRIKASSPKIPVSTLSGGNQQKVVLSKWLNTNAEVFIFDEPTRGVDIAAKVEIYQLINDLVENQKTVIFISSELPEILSMCDRAYVVCNGRIVCDYIMEEATEAALLSAALGESCALGENNDE